MQWLQQQWAKPVPSAVSRLLQPLSALYGLLTAIHRSAWRSELLTPQRAPAPLIVVGNLVAGGAGKTPAVLALLPRLRRMGYTPGVVSRGYGRRGSAVATVSHDSRAAEVGDEPLLIHLRGGAPVAVGSDRVAAARALCAVHPQVDLILADDGLQHHRMARDAELWVFDDRGIGNGLLLPAGPLRQHLPRRLPPNCLVLYSAGRRSTPLQGLVGHRRLAGVLALADWWQGAAPVADGWRTLRGRPLLAAAGLARPAPFFLMLEEQGLTIARLPLPDHHRFEPLPWPSGTPDVVVTEKDAVKLHPRVVGSTRVWVATLDFEPEPAFDAALRRLCEPLGKPHPKNVR